MGTLRGLPTLPRPNLQTLDFSRLALGDHLERTATDFAVGREALEGDTGIDDDVEGLAAKGALNGLGDFHAVSLGAVR